MENVNSKYQKRDEERLVGYFFDSYAVIELLKGNPRYAKYSEEVITLTIFNLVEIYWSALNDVGKEKADYIFNQFKECVVQISDEIVKEAIQFRMDNKKRNLSYADCIGYIYSIRNGLLFLTGDKEFEKLDHVEFLQ